MNEIQNIERRYIKRKNNPKIENFYFQYYAKSERELKYSEIIRAKWNCKFENCEILEVGAGGGDNLLFFHRLGISWKNIYANELLNERIHLLKEKLPYSTIIPGNALEMNFENFTSNPHLPPSSPNTLVIRPRSYAFSTGAR